jgi:hypothetical protein
MDPAAVTTLLESLTDQTLASEFEPVVCLEAPEGDEGLVVTIGGRGTFVSPKNVHQQHQSVAPASIGSSPTRHRGSWSRIGSVP